ncbi:ComEC/Rec2 family competence protein [Virgibacillus soli]|uniref:ComEC/Rec2 family competence protein n=1 Tax=Paracerasibacillus soli TaxID=480284 RepID=UPI0035E7A522
MRIKKTMFCMLLFILLLHPVVVVDAATNKKLDVHFIDVGQGDSILIQTPNQKVILIDGGPPQAGKVVVQYLRKHGIDKIDALITTHPDIDHIGGLPDVMQNFKIKEVIDSGKVHTTKAYANYINAIQKHQIPIRIVRESDEIEIDPSIDILVLNGYEQYKNNNQSSLVLKVIYDEVDFLFMSDVDHKQEKDMLKKYDMQADIIKIAHHGSKTSSRLPFLQEVNPYAAIITYGRENDFGHPVRRVIDNLYNIQSLIYSTAVFGHITIHSNGKEFYIIPEKYPMENIMEDAS